MELLISCLSDIAFVRWKGLLSITAAASLFHSPIASQGLLTYKSTHWPMGYVCVSLKRQPFEFKYTHTHTCMNMLLLLVLGMKLDSKHLKTKA